MKIRSPKRVLFSLALASLLASNLPALAMQEQTDGARQSGQRRAGKPPAPAGRRKSLEEIHAFVDRVRTFQDVSVKIDGLAAFAAVAQRSDAGMPADASGQGHVKRWANEKLDLESTLGQLRKMVGVKERDRRAVTLAAQYSAQKDLDAARTVANEISDEATRTKLLSILDYRRASEYLKAGELLRAEEAGARISRDAPPGAR